VGLLKPKIGSFGYSKVTPCHCGTGLDGRMSREDVL